MVSLVEVCYFYCQTVENMFSDDKLIVHYIQNYVVRQQHVHLLQNVQTLYFCNLSIAWTATLKLANTEFSTDNCKRNNSLSILNSIPENNPAGLPQHVHVAYFEIWLIQSNRGIIYHTITCKVTIIQLMHTIWQWYFEYCWFYEKT